jgi:hypothetical protein
MRARGPAGMEIAAGEYAYTACAAPRLRRPPYRSLRPLRPRRSICMRHLEWFHDHVRIEHMLFDGAPTLRDGTIAPNLTRPGLGLAFKERDAEQLRVR